MRPAESASVAQGIEQRFPVPCGGGSNPSRCVFLYPGDWEKVEKSKRGSTASVETVLEGGQDGWIILENGFRIICAISC